MRWRLVSTVFLKRAFKLGVVHGYHGDRATVQHSALWTRWRQFSSVNKMDKYKLIYFNLRARAEVIRYIFVHSGVEYEDFRYDYDEKMEAWMKDKPKMPFDQMPVLEVDGVQISQTFAIARFLAKKYGLTGKNDLETALVDMIVEACGDDSNAILSIVFNKDSDEEKRNEMTKQYQEETLPRFLENVENILVSNNGGDGYIVGDQLTWADLMLATHVTWPSWLNIPVPWNKAPKLKALCERVEALPRIAAWIKERPESKI